MSEAEFQRLVQQAQMLEGYYAQLTRQAESLQHAIMETVSAIEAAKALGGGTEQQALLPVGMGTFVKAKVPSADRLVVNVGAGVALEKDFKYAMNYLEVRLKEMETSLQEAAARRQQTESQLEGARQHLDRMMQQK